ncbi:MAG: cysteine methyltransferase [Propionibacteriales bacterium]|nr:MAG: cysteine methyltransferase [Propionibacteriales bacterium]
MSETIHYRHTVMSSPIGQILIGARNDAINCIWFTDQPGEPRPEIGGLVAPSGILEEAVRQLDQYFGGDTAEFELPLWIEGTPWQERVWKELARVAYGETITYAQLAERVESLKHARAVGTAVARNPLPILIGCHRVLPAGSDGVHGIGNFSSGADRKAYLLNLERESAAGHERRVRAALQAAAEDTEWLIF